MVSCSSNISTSKHIIKAHLTNCFILGLTASFIARTGFELKTGKHTSVHPSNHTLFGRSNARWAVVVVKILEI